MNRIAYINNQPHAFHEGRNDVEICQANVTGQEKMRYPRLCDAPNLDPFGSCRVCSVDVALEENGKTKTMASCHSPVSAGQYIYPDSKSVKKLRKNIMELVLTDHPLDCLTCEVNGNCELQDVAAQVGIREVRYPEGANHLDRQKDLSHPYMTSDMSKCINCYQMCSGL